LAVRRLAVSVKGVKQTLPYGHSIYTPELWRRFRRNMAENFTMEIYKFLLNLYYKTLYYKNDR